MAAHAADRAVIVYRAVNAVNGHSYIGFTTQGLSRRVQGHRRLAAAGGSYRFSAAIRKYGIENIKFEIMADFDGDEELAKAYECEAIAAYKPEYNLTYGGDGGTLAEESRKKIGDANRGRKMPASHKEKRVAFLTGRKHTAEAKAKISAANKGRVRARTGPPSAEVRAKLSAANKGRAPWITGKTHSMETRAKFSEWQRGRKLSDEHRANISAARVDAWANNRDKYLLAARAAAKAGQEARKLPVKCVEDGLVFPGCSDADRHYGYRIGLVSRIVKSTISNTTGKTFVRWSAS